MPRSLPTPANSTDIKGKDGPPHGVQMSFELPPPAITHGTLNSAGMDSRPSSASAKSSSASSYHPTSPQSPVQSSTTPAAKKRQTSSQAGSGKNGGATAQFALPPPPTRSRKIIQMKPRPTEPTAPAVGPPTTNTSTTASKGTPEKGKKKQPSSTSAAGRKIARKTAHSLIERRRRSKMNEEFGVLKDMIPACTGEMHKLAILQASIEYIRYLEDCVSQLKAQNQSQNPRRTSNRTPTPTKSTSHSRPSSTRPLFTFDNSNVASYADSTGANQSEEDDDQDVEMEDDADEEDISPTTYSSQKPSTFPLAQTQSRHPSVSPVAPPQDYQVQYRNPNGPQKTNSSYTSTTPINTNVQSHQNRQYSFSSYASQTPLSTSATTSPNLGPQTSPFIYPSSSASYTHSPHIYSSSGNLPTAGGSEYTYIRSSSISSSAGMHSQLTSPALAPMRERDSPYLGAVTDTSALGGDKTQQRVNSEREQENTAMAALLMLNSDRRGTIGGGGDSGGENRARAEDKGRGNLSLMDLLSA